MVQVSTEVRCEAICINSNVMRFIGAIDPQGRKTKKNKVVLVCPTLRAQIHGNPPCAVYEVKERIGKQCEN